MLSTLAEIDVESDSDFVDLATASILCPLVTPRVILVPPEFLFFVMVPIEPKEFRRVKLFRFSDFVFCVAKVSFPYKT